MFDIHTHTCDPQGRAGLPKYAIITALDGKPTPDLATFAALLRLQPQGARTPLEYFTFSERHRRKNAILHVDRQWCVCVFVFVFVGGWVGVYVCVRVCSSRYVVSP